MALKERPLSWGFVLCSMTWTLAWTFTPDEGSSVSPILANETWMNNTETPTTNYTAAVLSCASLLPPRRGSFYVEKGSGMSVGSVLVFWCLEGHQLVGSEKISCILHRDIPQWSNYPPDCEAIPKPEDHGLRVAVLASVVSCIVILAMSVSFIICCLQERISTERTDSRSRTRDKRKSSWRSECWLEREEGDWEAFPPPKIYNLSQHLDPHLSLDSPVYMGGLAGYDNRGYQRSQENLLKAPLPGLYRTESQVYPHVVLQRVPTPTVPTAPAAPSVPVYLRLSTPPSTESHIEQLILPPYPKPSYHGPSGTPQHPWP
ncbi:uncharacterized protein LOC127639263 isoform X1 [Xyrauchen texanus]|uniref:uncharacterized protein LOC127639263 isoform X1 n=1 Tax=Xyrauchen texanus TaxID=154827 RepID=UPI002242643F|nr:uncharacterized protein LOC127639263 isoform X1 [Xyrauchen texanus]